MRFTCVANLHSYCGGRVEAGGGPGYLASPGCVQSMILYSISPLLREGLKKKGGKVWSFAITRGGGVSEGSEKKYFYSEHVESF